MKLDIVLEEEEDGTYSVHCPALKGCHSQGRTCEEAIANIQEAIELYLESLDLDDLAAPGGGPLITGVEVA